MAPKYSIIIPVYNVERYLQACLDSVLAQNREDIEIIIVNDGSTDKSPEICRDFQNRHPELMVVIIDQKNRGLLASRRAGFARSTGQYCWTIDSDDTVHPRALDLVDEVVDATNADMVFFDYSLTDDYAVTTSCPPFKESGYFGPEDKFQLYRAYCRGRIYPLVTKVVRRECVCPEKNYEEFGKLNVSEDDLQVIDILNSINSAFYIHRPLYYYRQNAQSITGRYMPGMLREQARVETEKRKAVELWEKRYGNVGFMQDYAAGALSEWYFVCRKCITLANRKELLEELVGLECLDDLLARERSLRGDKKAFYTLANMGWYGLDWLFCVALTRGSTLIKLARKWNSKRNRS